MKKSFVFALAAVSLSSLVASADCSPTMTSQNLLCASYEFNLPVNIISTSPTLPAFTVYGGLVGIGTMTPDRVLTVAGYVHSTSGGFEFPDLTFQGTASKWLTTGTNMYMLSGNVGIGTNVPSFAGFSNALTIYSPTTRGSLEIASGQPDGTNIPSARIGFYATTTNAGNGSQIASILVSTDGTTVNDRAGVMTIYAKSDGGANLERMRITGTGRVGIGTTTPVTTLDVNGNMRLAKNAAAPYTCSSTYDGVIALTHVYTTCVCNGSNWVLTSDGTSACAW
jgi:hypothetical protein